MNCPKDLNSFLLSEPLFENTFPDNECEEKKFYGDCFHCFATSINKRDKQLINAVLDEIRAEMEMEKLEDSLNFCIKAHNDAIDRVLKIIDKYKTEGSEKE